MTDTPDPAELPDHDLSQGFPDYTPRPKDIVARHIPDDAPPIPSGPGQPYSFDELTEDGVTHFEGTTYVAPAIYPKEKPHE
jgi:hypothetical protein